MTISNKTKESSICLCMIVKNESKIMIRCLDSAKDAIDCVSILDTGNPSADDWDGGKTRDLIEQWGNENDIPTVVHNEPFVNFCVSRTRSVELATESFPKADYMLLLDADMVLEIKDSFDKSSLTHDSYTMKQYSTSIEYWNIRLINTKLKWRSRAVTHEYWEGKHVEDAKNSEVSQLQLKTLVIDDREDGGCKSDKYVRDERLLRAGLNNPDDSGNHTRYKFYLAQTLRSLSRYHESIEWYKKRVESGGWYEEIFYSRYQIANNYMSLYDSSRKSLVELKILLQRFKEQESSVNKMSKQLKIIDPEFKTRNSDITNEYTSLIKKCQNKIKYLENETDKYEALMAKWYLDSWNSNPKRIDSLYEHIKHLRIKGKQKLALFYALEAKKVKFPEDQKLFIDRKVWDYNLDIEIIICAFYVNESRKNGVDAILRVRKYNKENPGHISKPVMDNVEENAKWYSKTGYQSELSQ